MVAITVLPQILAVVVLMMLVMVVVVLSLPMVVALKKVPLSVTFDTWSTRTRMLPVVELDAVEELPARDTN